MARIAQGERDALGNLYDRTKARVYGLALRIVRESATAEEITLDVYTQVWRDAKRYDSGRSAVLSWLLLITRSRAVDYLRSKAGKTRAAETEWDAERFEVSSPDPTAPLEHESTAEAVRNALSALDHKKRRAIELAFFEGLTHTEIAKRLDAPLGTVKTRIRSGLNELRTALAATGGSA